MLWLGKQKDKDNRQLISKKINISMPQQTSSTDNTIINTLHAQIRSLQLASLPDDTRLSEIVKNIESATGVTLPLEEVKEEIKKYLETKGSEPTESKITSHKIEQIESKIGSMFRQFQDFPVQPSFPPAFPSEQSLKSANDQPPSYRSKRKIKPASDFLQFPSLTTIQEKAQAIDISTQDCNSSFERRSSKKQSPNYTSPGVNESNLWIYHEYFYCNYDRAYFKSEQPLMKKIIVEALKASPEKLTYKHQRFIRRALPKPKLFNAEFIATEIEKLWEFRAQTRTSPRNIKNKVDQTELTVGKEIVALHPSCGHLHLGSIFALYKENLFMVKFSKPELGTQKIQDIFISSKPFPSPSKSISDNIDHDLMAITIKLLEYKTELLRKMKDYNNQAQRINREQIPLDNQFLQEYGWIGSTINILTIGMKHIIAKFRLRGLSSAVDQDKVGKNFASILINPLNVMERQLDKSSQNSDINASEQIKRIITTHKENREQQAIKAMMAKYLPTFEGREWEDGAKKEEMERLLRTCVGLLVSLKCEGRNFNVDDNRWVNQLAVVTNGQFNEHFNEIYETLHSITGKLGEGAICALPS